uniref:Sodium/potassium-transporting ATPase subunit beta-1-interacting protein n=1 Tax=Stomoxys calcitrans TaxID=35570 RepID=A0A1I8NMS7_STOCA
MGSCTRRHFLLSTCFLQMITIIERQVFDFLGYMWAPIFVNFFHILFIIFGFYGAYHFRIKYIITDSDLLNLGTGSYSWFEVNGYGCKATYNTNITSEDPFRPLRPERVDDCLLTYDIVEVVHSGVQCILAFFGILGAILISYIFLDEDDRFDFMNGDAKSPQHTVVHPMYVSYTSIPTSASATMLSNKHHQQHLHHSLSNSNHHLSNSSHALATTTNTNSNTNTTTTPTAGKRQFRTSSSYSQPAPPPSSSSASASLHKQFSNNSHSHSHNHSHSNSHAAAAAAAAAAVGSNFLLTNSNNSYSASHANSSSISSGKRHNAASAATATNTNTFLIHTHKSNRSSTNNNNNNSSNIHTPNNNNMMGGVGSNGDGGGGGSFNGSLLSNSSQYQFNNNNNNNNKLHYGGSSGRRRCMPAGDLSSPMSTSYNTRSYSTNNSNASNSMLYSPKQVRKFGGLGGGGGGGGPLTSNSIFPANTATAIDLVQKPPGQLMAGGYYDDSTAKADHQLYANGGARRHIMAASSTLTQDTTPSLSYASLQNSNQNLNSSLKHGAGGTSLSNSNYSLTNSLNNNHPPSPAPSALGGASSNSGRFARIHSKPKPPKSSSYSNFSNVNANTNGLPTGNANGAVPRHDRPLSSNFDESFEDDNFSLQNLKADEDITYVPFGKPTPGSYFINKENNNLPSHYKETGQQVVGSGPSPNNNRNPTFANNPHSPPGILLEKGAILLPHMPEMNPAQRSLYQQNGLPFHPAYSPVAYRQNSACSSQAPPPRPTNIPLPIVPASYQQHQCSEMISPSEVTPPPPPQPRPHIFQPRTGTAPYPDLSPDVAERYAMPTQYIPRSPVASRIARRQRQQQQQNQNDSSGRYHQQHQSQQHDRNHVTNNSANFCDQIRDTPPGYRIHKAGGGGGGGGGGGKNLQSSQNSPKPNNQLSRARSHDRLSTESNGLANGTTNGSFRDGDKNSSATPQKEVAKEMAPNVNRRSGRRGEMPKPRPRSYCNSMSGGEGVIRANIASDRKMGYAA